MTSYIPKTIDSIMDLCCHIPTSKYSGFIFKGFKKQKHEAKGTKQVSFIMLKRHTIFLVIRKPQSRGPARFLQFSTQHFLDALLSRQFEKLHSGYFVSFGPYVIIIYIIVLTKPL